MGCVVSEQFVFEIYVKIFYMCNVSKTTYDAEMKPFATFNYYSVSSILINDKLAIGTDSLDNRD